MKPVDAIKRVVFQVLNKDAQVTSIFKPADTPCVECITRPNRRLRVNIQETTEEVVDGRETAT